MFDIINSHTGKYDIKIYVAGRTIQVANVLRKSTIQVANVLRKSTIQVANVLRKSTNLVGLNKFL